MAAKCYFTGKKAKRSCPGVKPGQPVPISAEACTQRMVYEIACPSDCRHLQGNFEWFLDRTASRMAERMKEEPWLGRLIDSPDSLDLFLELERRLAMAAPAGEAASDEDVAKVMTELQTASRAKNTGLVIAASTFEVAATGPLYHRLALALDLFRSSHFSEGDAPPPEFPSFYHKLLKGREELARRSQKDDAPRLGVFSPAVLRQLQDHVPTNPAVEQRVQETIEVLQRSLDHRRSRGGYVAFLGQFY